MQRNTFNHRTGLSSHGLGEIDDFGQERYYDMLREAEQQRLVQRATRASAKSQSAVRKSTLTRLLNWVGLF